LIASLAAVAVAFAVALVAVGVAWSLLRKEGYKEWVAAGYPDVAQIREWTSEVLAENEKLRGDLDRSLLRADELVAERDEAVESARRELEDRARINTVVANACIGDTVRLERELSRAEQKIVSLNEKLKNALYEAETHAKAARHFKHYGCTCMNPEATS